jgi:hypothetical protein
MGTYTKNNQRKNGCEHNLSGRVLTLMKEVVSSNPRTAKHNLGAWYTFIISATSDWNSGREFLGNRTKPLY